MSYGVYPGDTHHTTLLVLLQRSPELRAELLCLQLVIVIAALQLDFVDFLRFMNPLH